jgi:lipoprotein-releasing system ATP-binding protein
LLEDYSALENVLMPAKIARTLTTKGSQANDRALELLQHVGLANRAHFNTKLLSGGEKQRVAIARALCNNPQLIFADEPSGNLDRQTSAAIHELLLDFSRAQGKSIIFATHDKDLAALCDVRYVLQEGLLHRE